MQGKETIMSLFNQLIPFQSLRPVRRNGGSDDEQKYVIPAYRVREANDAFGLEVFVPGVVKKGVELEVEQDQLVITARRDWKAPEGWSEVFRETPAEDYRLRLNLSESVAVDKINAELEQGVLRVTLPKAEELKPRKIEIH